MFRGADALESPLLSTPDLRMIGWLFARSAVTSVISFVVLVLGGCCVGFFTMLDASSSYEQSGPSDPYILLQQFSAAITLVPLLTFTVFVITLLLPHRQLVSEWHLVLDGHAALAETAYTAVCRDLVRRQLPICWDIRWARDAMQGRLIRRLIVRDAKFTVYVSALGYGNDLYLGWQLWRNELGVQVLGAYIRALFVSPIHDLRGSLAADRARALRDAVHNALRSAIEAAAANQVLVWAEQFPTVQPVWERAPGSGPAVVPPSPAAPVSYEPPAGQPWAPQVPTPRPPVPPEHEAEGHR